MMNKDNCIFFDLSLVLYGALAALDPSLIAGVEVGRG